MATETESIEHILDKVLASKEVQEKVNIAQTFQSIGREVPLPSAYTNLGKR